MQFNLIVSTCRNNGIGLNNKIPWHVTDDLRYFAKLTKGDGLNAVIMGHQTWQSLPNLPNKPRGLIERDNFVLSGQHSFDMLINHGRLVKTFKTVDEIETYLSVNNTYREIWVIGGAQIYKHFLDLNKIKKCYVTYVDEDFECDTFFPIDFASAADTGQSASEAGASEAGASAAGASEAGPRWIEVERTDTYDKTYECLVRYSVYEPQLDKAGAAQM